jgi:hypothetical protein
MPSTDPAGSLQNDPTETASRHWLLATLAIWLVAALALIGWKWGAIHWFALGDTDDNLRMSQVRALLAGQDWFDLRQHRLDPLFGGANIHWSRLVDLPIAGLILTLKPLIGGVLAEKWAAGIAPLIPFGVALWAGALAVRRLVAPMAFALAAAVLLCAANAMSMWMPLRIDHHGWQLALLMLSVAAIADERRARWLGVGRGQRGIARDRAGNAALYRARGGAHRAALGGRSGRGTPARRLWRVARGGLWARLCRLRVVGQ